MAQLIGDVQDRLKSSSSQVLLFSLRLVSGALLGLTIALVLLEMIGYGNLAFSLVLVAITLLFLRTSRKWGYAGVLIFDLICVLIAGLLRMYILIAPGA